jgi:hypothetical protein
MEEIQRMKKSRSVMRREAIIKGASMIKDVNRIEKRTGTGDQLDLFEINIPLVRRAQVGDTRVGSEDRRSTRGHEFRQKYIRVCKLLEARFSPAKNSYLPVDDYSVDVSKGRRKK